MTCRWCNFAEWWRWRSRSHHIGWSGLSLGCKKLTLSFFIVVDKTLFSSYSQPASRLNLCTVFTDLSAAHPTAPPLFSNSSSSSSISSISNISSSISSSSSSSSRNSISSENKKRPKSPPPKKKKKYVLQFRKSAETSYTVREICWY